MKQRTATIELEDGTEVILPTRWEICGTCQGHNVSTAHVEHEGGGITAEEMDELGEDFREDYFNGVYDLPCPDCEGGKTLVVDQDRLTDEQREAWLEKERDDHEYEAIRRMERRMGA